MRQWDSSGDGRASAQFSPYLQESSEQMAQFPKRQKTIAERIRRYERALRRDKRLHGSIDDGAGNRYLLGALYLMLDDPKGALKSYKWLERTIPDDMGEPFDYLCWTLTLYRVGDLEAAAEKLRQTMLRNLYLIPALIGAEQDRLEMRHGTNWAEKEYAEYAPAEYFALWDEAALDWAAQTYHSAPFCEIREQYITICQQLDSEPVGPKRSQLVREKFRLQTE